MVLGLIDYLMAKPIFASPWRRVAVVTNACDQMKMRETPEDDEIHLSLALDKTHTLFLFDALSVK